MREVRTVCPRDCYDTCFMIAMVEGSRLVSVRGDPSNPVTRGFLCPRGAREVERVYRNRILYPHVRTGPKPGRRFRRASWSEALDLVAAALRRVLEEHGPGAVLHLEYAGNMGLLTWYFPQRLWYALGAARTDYSICSKSGHEAIGLHYGLSYGILPDELPGMRLVVFWGFNAAVSAIHIWSLALEAQRRGALIAVVDPRRSETVSRADLWLSPRPGSDVALAYGIANYLIERGHVDLSFVRQWVSGYEEFRREAAKWSLDRVGEVTGVEKGLIEELGEAYGVRKPSATMIGLGLQKSRWGAEAVRAVSLIPALLGLHRGFYYSNSRGWLVDLQYLTGEKLCGRRVRVVSQVALADHVERGEFKFIYVYNMNPLATLPGQRALRRGLLRGDVFLVVHDSHWAETAEYADVVLPAPTFLEKEDLVIPYSHCYVRVSRRAIPPLGESRDEVWVMRELARRLGVREEWVYEDPWAAVRRALSGALEGSSEDMLWGGTLKLRMRSRSEYQTPSGRIELYSARAAEAGLSPLPRQAKLEVPKSWFLLLNSATPRYTHTQFREVYGPIPPIVLVNPDDAAELGLEDGDRAALHNELGRVEVRVVVSSDVPRGVLWSPRQLIGLDGELQNSLVSTETQEIGGGPTFNSTLVKLERGQ